MIILEPFRDMFFDTMLKSTICLSNVHVSATSLVFKTIDTAEHLVLIAIFGRMLRNGMSFPNNGEFDTIIDGGRIVLQFSFKSFTYVVTEKRKV